MLSPEYWILLFLLFICLFYYKEEKFVIVVILYMTILAVCRDVTVGTDFMGYEKDFSTIKSLKSGTNIRHGFEIGFVFLITQFKTFSNNYPLFISLWFFPCIIGIIKFVYDHKVNWAFAFFFYFTMGFYFMSFNIMRQLMVVSVSMMYLPFLYKKKYWLYAILIVLTAFLFHKSEIMLLVLIPIHYYSKGIRKPICKNFLYAAIVISFLVFYIGSDLLKTSFVSITMLLLDSQRYVNYILFENDRSGNSTSLLFTIMGLVLVYVKSPYRDKFLTYVFVLSIIMFNIFNTFSLYATRVAIPFQIFGIILIPKMIFDRGTKYRLLFMWFVIFLCMVLFLNKYYINNSGAVNPYVFRTF